MIHRRGLLQLLAGLPFLRFLAPKETPTSIDASDVVSDPISPAWFVRQPPWPVTYVSDKGDDAWDGLSAKHEGGARGPKRTLAAAFAAAGGGWVCALKGCTFRS